MHGAGLEVRAARTTPSKNIQWVTRHFPPSTLMARLRCHLLHSVGEMRPSLLGCQGGLLMEVHQQLNTGQWKFLTPSFLKGTARQSKLHPTFGVLDEVSEVGHVVIKVQPSHRQLGGWILGI